ncbi:hypothetical protein [Nocardiopsis alba]|uniref:hypothetical protein n=1 Tax=Nocardiopsis alba TaxID=53437 RepID=UPI00363FA2C7
MTETDVREGPGTTGGTDDRARLWEIADQARALARSFSKAEEALDALDEADPPPRSELSRLDRDDSMVAPPDPMPSTFEEDEEEWKEPAPKSPPPLSWGTVARILLALGTAALTGWAGALLLRYSMAPDMTGDAWALLWFPGALVALATSGAAVSLRRSETPSPRFGPAPRRTPRWSVPAISVFVCGTVVTAGVLGLSALWWTGTPSLVGLVAAVGVVALLAQIPPYAPEPLSWAPPGLLLGAVMERSRTVRGRRTDRRTVRRWRRLRGRARAAIRSHTEAWQAVHHRCHLEVDLGNSQARQLAEALLVLRGGMFGRELPGDSDNAPGVAPLVGSMEVAVHGLTNHHPDRLIERLRRSNDPAKGYGA